MRVAPSTCQMAMLEIYRACRRNAGESLSDVELMQAWKKTGLRQSDLRIALQAMMEHRLLVLHEKATGSRLELTNTGQNEVKAPHEDWVSRAADWFTLQRTKRRNRGQRSSGDFLGRRRTDHMSNGGNAPRR